jgi:hypothetical protein
MIYLIFMITKMYFTQSTQRIQSLLRYFLSHREHKETETQSWFSMFSIAPCAL